jgi:Tfp pilus assembly protein PilN
VSQVNLLPPELRQRQQVRRLTSAIVVAGVIILALIGAFYFLQTQRLADVEDDIAAQEQTNAALQAQIAELQQFADLQAELATKQQLVQTLFLNEVSWSSVLLDISRVIPDASYLTNMTGQISATTGSGVAGAPTAPPTGDPESTLIGSMSFTGVAGETQTISTWLTRLEQVRGWVNPWVTSAQENAPFSRIYTFASGLDLSLAAATDRGQGGVQP